MLHILPSQRVLGIFKKVATIVKNVATIEKVVATIDTTIATIASGLLRFKSTCNLRYTCSVLLLNRPPSVIAGYPPRFALRDTCNHGGLSILPIFHQPYSHEAESLFNTQFVDR